MSKKKRTRFPRGGLGCGLVEFRKNVYLVQLGGGGFVSPSVTMYLTRHSAVRVTKYSPTTI